MVASGLLWQTGLLVLVKRGVETRGAAVAHFATGLLGIGKNKGAVLARLALADDVRLVFVGAHLAAHMGAAHHRNLSASWVTDAVRFPWAGAPPAGARRRRTSTLTRRMRMCYSWGT